MLSAGTLQAQKLIFIRHGEKPLVGTNLNCAGLNRSLKLPTVLYQKFGKPDFLFVPGLGLGDTTKHSRMFQTIVPTAIRYNLIVNTSHHEKDFPGIAADLKSRKGTIIITWEHKAIPGILKALGISDTLTWPNDDFDSVWIVTFQGGIPKLTIDHEDIHPSDNCSI